jgi:hypothetical protein
MRPVMSPYWAADSLTAGLTWIGSDTVSPAGMVMVEAPTVTGEIFSADPSSPVTPATESESV